MKQNMQYEAMALETLFIGAVLFSPNINMEKSFGRPKENWRALKTAW